MEYSEYAPDTRHERCQRLSVAELYLIIVPLNYNQHQQAINRNRPVTR